MRALGWLVGLGVLATPGIGAAASVAETRPAHPLHAFAASESGPSSWLRSVALSGALGPHARELPTVSRSALDCVHARHDITLDPLTGDTTATLDLEVRAAGGELAAVAFSFDQGLSVTSAAADGRTATASDSVVGAERVVRIDFSPALADGQSTTLHVAYSGTLACGANPNTGAVLCTKGSDFAYFPHQSVYPFLFDPIYPLDQTLDSLTRDIVLRVPYDVDVVATGEKVDETNDGTTRVSSWSIDHPLARTLGLYVFAGHLGSTAIDGRSVPTSLVFPAPGDGIDTRLSTWSPGVLAWVEQLTGDALPFSRSLTLVRLPANVGDPGTATFGMTLLSDSYARSGELLHEETWAHENTHLFWGITVPEVDPASGRLMTEGMATLSEIDYTYAHHYAAQDRDRYLAQRFVPIGMDLRIAGASIPAVQTSDDSGLAYGTSEYTMWAYEKTAATLDHLRTTIGEDAFNHALGAYVSACSYIGCRPDDFRAMLEKTTGTSMTSFFDRWVNGSSRPRVTIETNPGGATLRKDDDIPMTLELWVRLEDDRLVKRRVDLGGKATNVSFADLGTGVRSVTASPRHDVLVDVRSAVEGDLDFDGETDGFDLFLCTRLAGVKYAPKSPGTGLWMVDEQFDPRCDLDGNLVIDDVDIAAIAQTFGNLRDP
ncbi:MAG TPA: M1 family aminopeptidase [Labilithrix sp.]